MKGAGSKLESVPTFVWCVGIQKPQAIVFVLNMGIDNHCYEVILRICCFENCSNILFVYVLYKCIHMCMFVFPDDAVTSLNFI